MSEERFDRDTGEIVHSTYRRSNSLGDLFAALAKAQGAFKSAERAGENPHFRSKYATLESVVGATQEPLSTNGLAIIQFPANVGNAVGVTTILGHASGQWLEHTFAVVPAKFDAQGAGSAITYLRRYGRMSVCGIAAEDDDGNAAVAPGPAARPNGPATRVNPAVAPANPAEDNQRRIARQIKYALDAAKSPEELREIYDPILEEWGEGYQDDAALLNTVTLNFLRSHVRSRMQQIGAQ